MCETIVPGKNSMAWSRMEKNVRLFVLAGGKGERFFPFSSVIPKCLIPVAGKPCIRWIIEDALAQGFDDIVLCINKNDSSSYRHELRDVNLKYSISEEAHGTVGELLCARNFVTGPFVLRYGDDLTETNYLELLRFHVEKKAIATLVVTTELDLPVGIVDVAECGKVVGFVEKPKLGRPSWVGIAVFEPRALDFFGDNEDVASDVLPRMLRAGEPVYAFVMHKPWYDVGNIEHWRKADDYFKNGKKSVNNDRQ